ncbi:Histone-fold [Kalmanozyma brasiliensis GHG001]|uniref:Histone-fold n=1 Tax=Kalmanozyma brasiliensis (strain GHG001) TaxID=1365824 RepID=UPI002867BD9E|nr:Histone-fold [Kalmanozyma brasiliensis GHG001]KAF6767223.1 Histone-fold [Kalmanozyma brasiliensis GHG001]
MPPRPQQSVKCLPGQTSGRAARATRRYRAQRTALERITKGSLRRLARRGGVQRIAGTVYEESRFILRDFLTQAIRDAVVYARRCFPFPLSLVPPAPPCSTPETSTDTVIFPRVAPHGNASLRIASAR